MTANPALAQQTLTAPKIYRDDLGRVFDGMRMQYGECFDLPVGIKYAEADEFAWEWYSHVEFDGIGVMGHIARKHDHDLVLPQLKIRPDRRATLLDHLRPLVRRSYLRAA